MITVQLRRPVFLAGTVSASLAMLSVETIAQPRSGPERPLSVAIAQAKLGPFHGGHAFAEPGDQRFRLLTVGSVASSPDRAGLAPSSAPGTPHVGFPAVDGIPSRDRVFLWTTLAAVVGYAGTIYGLPLCRTATLRPGEVCVLSDDTVPVVAGFLATIAMTGGAAALAGSGFWRSQAGSALGFVGGVLGVVGIQLIGFDLSDEVRLGVLALGHAAITTLIAG